MKKCKCSEELLQDSVVKCPKCENEELETDLDSSGVPFKNREREIERKRKEIEAEKERIKLENQRLQAEREQFNASKNNPETVNAHYEQEAERTGVDANTLKETDRRVNEQANKIFQQREIEREEASRTINSTLESLESTDYPSIAKYRDEIISQIKLYPVLSQRNPELIKTIAFGILGKNLAGKESKAKPEPKVQSTTTISGGGSAGGGRPVQSTDDELEFALQHGLGDRDAKEVRELYNEFLKSHPKK